MISNKENTVSDNIVYCMSVQNYLCNCHNEMKSNDCHSSNFISKRALEVQIRPPLNIFKHLVYIGKGVPHFYENLQDL